MGIDKDNVGFVIHLSPSPSIENYYQEIGRAGRNGQNAETILLWNQSELTQIDDLMRSQLASKTDYQKSLFLCLLLLSGRRTRASGGFL
jgi:ATP-dependent DNA helicase RecQ